MARSLVSITDLRERALRTISARAVTSDRLENAAYWVLVTAVYASMRRGNASVWCCIEVEGWAGYPNDNQPDIFHVPAHEISGSAVVDMIVASFWRRAGVNVHGTVTVHKSHVVRDTLGNVLWKEHGQ